MCNLYSSKDLLSSETNSTYSHYCQKKAGNKTEYTLTDNSYASFNHAKPHVLFIMFMFCLLDRTIHICVSCFRTIHLVLWVQFSHNDHWMFNMAKNSLRIWELELLLSTKMAESIRSSVTTWNWVTVQWPGGSYRGFPRRVSLGTGLTRVNQRSWVLVLCVRCRSWLQKTFIVRFVMHTEPKASYRKVKYEYAHRYTPNICICVYMYV